MKAARIASVVIVFMLVLSLSFVNNASSLISPPTPTIILDPPQIIDTTNTLNNFTININIANVSIQNGLSSWDVKIRYNPILLYTDSSLIQEGPFLKNGGPTFFAPPHLETDYLEIGCSIIVQGGYATGSGTLANVTFLVERRGETLLDLFDTKLANANGDAIAHSSRNSYFRNIDSSLIPESRFVYYAQTYNVTFNATSSFSPDSTINTYTWIWGGKSLDSIKESTTSYPATWHHYPETIPPQNESALVRLIVTDYKNVTSNIFIKLIAFGVLISDVALTAVESAPAYVLIGNHSTVISVNVTNFGNQLENTGVTISYNSTFYDFQNITATQWATLQTQPVNQLAGFENRTTSFVWNTTGLPIGYYAIKAEASRVSNETNASNNVLVGSVSIVLDLPPIAIFKYYPNYPQADQQVTFNASQSYDPDGTIISYNWDFGDSSQLLTSQSSINHTYGTAGTFSITLTVTDDYKLHTLTSLSIAVSKLESTIFLSAFTSTAIVNSNATINGVLSSKQSTSNVTILYRFHGQYVWNILGNTQTSSEGLFSYSWKPSAAGTYEFKTQWEGNQKYIGAASNIITAIAKYNSSLTLSENQPSAAIGESIKISGNIKPARYGAVVTILYKQGEDSWSILAKTVTDENGAYTLNWKPSAAGTYQLKAEWNGDDQSVGAESLLTSVAVTESSGTMNYFPFAVAAAAIVVVVLLTLFWTLRKRGAGQNR